MTDGPSSLRGRSRASFTLVELVVVLAIMALAFSMIAFLPKGAKRDADVQAAAEELASTLRLARSMAMDRHAVYAVSFNIQNAPGTSGKVLNNWSGGHWYRILGPNENAQLDNTTDAFATYPVPCFWPWVNNLTGFLSEVKSSWVGDRHTLAPHKVRFLALADQDNGGSVYSFTGDTNWNTFPATYPRPWFGIWDAGTKRLYPWGGYDPTIINTLGKSCSGFYFSGNDGPLAGCLNPTDRISTDGLNTRIFTQGQPRPLINGEWEDYIISFLPDGSVCEGQVMGARLESYLRGAGGIADLSCQNSASDPFSSTIDWNPQMNLTSTSKPCAPSPITSYVAHTGFWSMTLAPDADADSDSFQTAQDAVFTLMPAYRVMINRFGLVKVVKVVPYAPAGTVMDTTIQGTDWQDRTKTRVSYANDVATDATTGLLRGMPAADFVTPSMMANRNWWMASP